MLDLDLLMIIGFVMGFVLGMFFLKPPSEED